MSPQTRPTPPHLTSAMAENILAAACESETRKAAKRMRLEIYQTSQVLCSRQEGCKTGQEGRVGGLGPSWRSVFKSLPQNHGAAGWGAGEGEPCLVPATRWPSRPRCSQPLLPCAGRADRPRQAALQRLHSHHPLLLFTASLVLLPRPRLHQWKPELQLPWLRVPGRQPAATRAAPDREPQ